MLYGWTVVDGLTVWGGGVSGLVVKLRVAPSLKKSEIDIPKGKNGNAIKKRKRSP